MGFSVAIGGILLIAIAGQFAVHALFYQYDNEGKVVLTPAENGKTRLNSTYQHVVAKDRGDSVMTSGDYLMNNGAGQHGPVQAVSTAPV